ncbi:MAG TPA: BON domain-containing protein [Rhodocyclaceae bacterium]|nr:BON domain-containing protein [Rhodocyclaceae bacterium]
MNTSTRATQSSTLLVTMLAIAISTCQNSTASPLEGGQPMLIAESPQGMSAYPLGTDQETSIVSRVQQALSSDPGIGGQGIAVRSDKAGTVILSGTVRSPEDAERARRLTATIPGVRYVDDRLAVQSGGNPPQSTSPSTPSSDATKGGMGGSY